MLCSPVAGRGQQPPARDALQPPSAPPASPVPWREAPEYVALFAPRAYRGAYRAFVSPTSLDAVLHAVARDPRALQAPGAWTPRPQLPFDAFGAGGTYDRWKIARLYGSRRTQVARGPHRGDAADDESWTLVSPYPSAALDRLEPGTLLLMLRVP